MALTWELEILLDQQWRWAEATAWRRLPALEGAAEESCRCGFAPRGRPGRSPEWRT